MERHSKTINAKEIDFKNRMGSGKPATVISMSFSHRMAA